MDNKKSCCITGLPIYELPVEFSSLIGKASTKLYIDLSEAVDSAIDVGYTTFVTGNACGADLLAKWAVEDLLWRSGGLCAYQCNDIAEKLNDFGLLIIIMDSLSSFDSAQELIKKASDINLDVVMLDVRQYM